MKRNRGQVTIFIILSIIFIMAIIAILLLVDRKGSSIGSDDLNPQQVVTGCVQDVVESSIYKVMMNGGEVSPWLSIAYDGDSWTYLCYQADFYQSCYNLHPMLELQVEREIEKDTSVGVQSCFNSMKDDFESRGYDVSGGATHYSIDLLPGYVDVKLNKNIKISGEGGSESFDNFGIRISSSAYDLVKVAREVVNSESQFCNFEYNGYMLLYPKYNIRRIDYKDSKIYRVIDRVSGSEFRFAVRSCAFPPGI